MTISLEKKLAEATVAKRRYRLLFIVSAGALLLFSGIVYQRVVLDYAEIDQVRIQRSENSNRIDFTYTIVTPGRLDFHYGQAILTDRKTQTGADGFQWNWRVSGDTTIAIRSRRWLLPRWDRERFRF